MATTADNFNVADGTNVDGRTATDGGSWTKHSSFSGGACDVRSNRARPGTGETVICHSKAIDRSYEIAADVVFVAAAGGSYGGLWLGAASGTKTGYEIDRQSSGVYLGKYVSGTYSALGSWVSTQTAGTTAVIAVHFEGNDVVVLVDGVERIRVTDSSITPAVFGVYGGGGSTSTGFHIDNVTYGQVSFVAAGNASETDTGFSIFTAPAAPTLTASGSLLGVALGADIFGRAIFKVTAVGADSVSVVERSSDGSTWFDISSRVSVSGTGPFLVADNRPDRASQSIAQGGTAYYRVKVSNAGGASGYSSTLSVSTVGLDVTAIHSAWGQANYDYLSVSANANAEADGAYPGVWLSGLAWLAKDGYAPSSGTYLSLCSTFWALVKSRSNINADYLHTPQSYATGTRIRRDFHFRLILHLLVASRLLRQLGGSTANALAADMEDYANRMGKAAFDHLNPTTCTDTSTGDTYQTAWAPGSFAAGEIRKPTTPNGHYYRAQNAGSNTTEPTWPTSQGATVTHQGVTWKECSYTANTFAQTYDSTTYFNTGAYSWDGNQNSEIAAALLLLRSLNTSDFYPGGSYASTGYNHAIGELNLCAVMQYRNGEIPVVATGPHDTHYGSFQLHTTAIALHELGSGVVPQADLWLTRALNWFTNYFGTEGTISNAGVGGFATYQISAEQVWRAAGYEVAGISNPLDDIEYRAAFNIGDATVSTHASWYEYRQWGWAPGNTIQPYAYNFEAVADYDAILSAQSINVGQGTEADTGLGASPTTEASVTIGVGTEADDGLAITPDAGAAPQSVAVGLASEADSGLPVTPIGGSSPQSQNVGLASETDTGLAATPVAPADQSVQVDLPVEVDEGLGIAGRAIGVGVITMNMQLPPGTVVGAYMRHEWIGSEVPVRGTGSYPGTAVQEVAVDDYGQVAFEVPAGSYIAWTAGYPLRRRFFVVTD